MSCFACPVVVDYRNLFNPRARLRCLVCGTSYETAMLWTGCPRCPDPRPLVVDYDDRPALAQADAASLGEAIAAIAAQRTPLAAAIEPLTLGQGNTPLVPFASPGGDLYLKMEGQNPTGSHKDRFQGLATTLARAAGAPGVVTSSTGNHGTACAAFAAAAKLPCLVFLNQRSPRALQTQIAAHAAHIAMIPGGTASALAALVDRGWFPATTADPAVSARANPYGQEAYRSIAYEIAADLGRAPDVVAVPAAGGDTVYAIWRGFRDLEQILGVGMPTVLACQPEGAAPLVATEQLAAMVSQTVPEPFSLAASTCESRTGWHATVAIRDSGAAVAVTERAIRHAWRELADQGFFVEPASAVALAGLRHARQEGLVGDGVAVCIATSSGQNWAADIDTVLGEPSIITTLADLERLAETAVRANIETE